MGNTAPPRHLHADTDTLLHVREFPRGRHGDDGAAGFLTIPAGSGSQSEAGGRPAPPCIAWSCPLSLLTGVSTSVCVQLGSGASGQTPRGIGDQCPVELSNHILQPIGTAGQLCGRQAPWAHQPVGLLSLICSGAAFVTARLFPGGLHPQALRLVLQQADTQSGAGTGRALADICRRNDPSRETNNTGSPSPPAAAGPYPWRQGTPAVGEGEGGGGRGGQTHLPRWPGWARAGEDQARQDRPGPREAPVKTSKSQRQAVGAAWGDLGR